MNRITIAALTLLAGLAAVQAQAACIYPRAPENIPDGSTATLEQMIEAQKAVKQFDADISAYNACLDMELQALLADPSLDEARRNELKVMHAKKNNAAVDDAQVVVDRFNEQRKAYMEAQKKGKD